MRLISLASAAAAVLLSGSAFAASGPNYTFLEGGYRYIDVDDFDDGDGIGIGGSLAATENVHLVAEYDTVELDNNIDFDTVFVGGGLNLPLDADFDLVARLGYVSAEVDAGFGDVDDDGLGLQGGFRFMATEVFEVNAFIDYVDLDDSGDDTSLNLGAVYNFTPQFALGGVATFSDDVNGLAVNFRWYPQL